MSDDNGHDYESLGNNSTMAQNALAGALAGIGEHCIMYPIDSIRVRLKHGLMSNFMTNHLPLLI